MNSGNGEVLNVTFLVENTLSRPNNVSQASDWVLPAFGNVTATMVKCIGWANALILRGYYDLQNVSTSANSTIMPLFQPGVGPNCTYYDFARYYFEPSSSKATVFGQGPYYGNYSTRQMIAGGLVAGYYTANQSYVELNRRVAPLPFPPGTYTIAVNDEWGQLALLHFVISSTTIGQPSLTTSMATTNEENYSSSAFTVTTHTLVLSLNPTFAYDHIPYSFRVGNFSIDMVNNGTGYTSPPVNGTSRTYLSYTFAFNVTTPRGRTTNAIFTWWPPCSTNLGLPCIQNDSLVLPSPANATVNYGAANLLIQWYKNTTGLYISFQEWDNVITTTTIYGSSTFGGSSSSSNQSSMETTTNSSCVSMSATMPEQQSSAGEITTTFTSFASTQYC